MEADGRTHLQDGTNRGDAGDPFPGSSSNANFTATTTPGSLAYSGLETCVSLTGIAKSGASIKAKVSVSCPLHVPAPPKPATRKPAQAQAGDAQGSRHPQDPESEAGERKRASKKSARR